MIKEPIETLKQIKKDFSNKMIFSVFVAAMVSVLAGGLVEYFDKYSIHIIIAISVILVLFGIIYSLCNIKKASRDEVIIKAFFIYNSKKNDCISIPRYNYSYDFVHNLKALFVENPNEKKMWNKDKLKFFEFSDGEHKHIENNFSVGLLKENMEYCVLDTLSMILTDYFNAIDGRMFIQKYKREDMAQLLAQNRFLNTFSRSMEERSAFVTNRKKEKKVGTIVRAFGKNGEIYDRFDLVLPKKSTIEKTDKGFIIVTPKVVLTAEFDINGYTYVTPSGFKEYYLNIPDDLMFDVSSYCVDIKIKVKFNFLQSLLGQLETSHKWVDKFINTLQRDYSAKEFFDKINWEHNLLIYEAILKNKKS